MKKFIKLISRALYKIIKALPSSSSRPFGKISNFLRYILTKSIIEKCGKAVTVERNALFSPNIMIGDNSGLGTNCRITGKCIIGKYVMMGPNVSIYTRNHAHNRIDIPMCKQGNEEEKPVIIENDVWIGANAIILPGIKIGEGVIVGAGAVVTHDVPPFAIVGGNPAKIISYRNKEQV